MIARRKKAFYRLVELLREIESDLDNLDAVEALNLALLKEILRDEEHIARHKATIKELRRSLKTRRYSKDDAAILKAKSKRLAGYVRGYQDQIYIWKSIGDALAYAYISPFNMKHAFFETDSTGAKPTAGAISGKQGLEHELSLLLLALQHDVPAVLCDITNVIRYGDICLLGDADPVPIEVKSQKRLNQRGLRQKAKLETLQGFLERDHASNFRGMPEVRRASLTMPYRDCRDALNSCVTNAMKDGYCVLCPERGLVYVATIGGSMSELLASLEMGFAVVSHINIQKSEKLWAPYLSFINSIRDLDNLYAFITGSLSVLVCVDGAYLCEQVLVPGWAVSLVDDHNISIVVTQKGGDGRVAVSRQMMGRLFYEFMSLEWFVAHECEAMENIIKAMKVQLPSMIDASWAGMSEAIDAMPKLVERA